MNNKNFKWILYIIILVIASTIAIQVYWNYKNYQVNKQQFVNDVQVSIDNAVGVYYENLAKKNTLGFNINENNQKGFFKKDGKFETLITELNIDENGFTLIDSISSESTQGFTIFKGSVTDCLKTEKSHKFPKFNLSNSKDKVKWEKFKDSIKKDDAFELLTSKVFISITHDTLNLKAVDSLFKNELQRKNLNIDYGLSYKDNNTNYTNTNKEVIEDSKMTATSSSLFLPEEGTLKVHYKNETKIILKRILSSILMSLLLIIALISCLFYMLKVINRQKQLAEVKNDLISNITHEFKTPIATIGVALESIKNFNVINDKAKTEKYIDMSNSQLSKLNIMVEKLLETATLDSESLDLNVEDINLNTLIQLLIEKHQIQSQHKTIVFKASSEDIMAKVDAFHFENAINNITDNAIKYGGDTIEVHLTEHKNNFQISISDNGTALTKIQANQIFEKFYRVPKGNQHDVKGFGIGLYYTKKIIEKHHGSISVTLKPSTTFKINMPK